MYLMNNNDLINNNILKNDDIIKLINTYINIFFYFYA